MPETGQVGGRRLGCHRVLSAPGRGDEGTQRLVDLDVTETPLLHACPDGLELRRDRPRVATRILDGHIQPDLGVVKLVACLERIERDGGEAEDPRLAGDVRKLPQRSRHLRAECLAGLLALLGGHAARAGDGRHLCRRLALEGGEVRPDANKGRGQGTASHNSSSPSLMIRANSDSLAAAQPPAGAYTSRSMCSRPSLSWPSSSAAQTRLQNRRGSTPSRGDASHPYPPESRPSPPPAPPIPPTP